MKRCGWWLAVGAVGVSAGSRLAAQDTSALRRIRTTPTAAVRAAIAAQGRVRPSVVDSTIAAAVATLSRLGIRVVSRDSIVPARQSGVVLRQIPTAGTRVVEGALDTVVVARRAFLRPEVVSVIPGFSYRTVPNVIDSTYRGAVAQIERAGLVAEGPEVTGADSARARVVVQMLPPRQQVAPKSVVHLQVAIAPRVVMPSVVGYDTSVARQILRRARLAVGSVTAVYDERLGPGLVTHQDPEAGDPVAPEMNVALHVSMGPHADSTGIVVPTVLGMSFENARAVLRKLRLNSHLDTSWVERDSGLIVHQEPHAGATAHPGDMVVLMLALPPMAIVPDLVDLTLSAAESTLRRSQLAMGAVKVVVDTTRRDGVVVHQSVRSGTGLQVGAAVDVEVNARPSAERVVVPDLRGMTFAAAAETLAGRRLSVGALRFQTSQEGNRIVDQQPVAGTRVAPRTEVAMTLEIPPDVVEPLITMPSVVDSPLTPAIQRLDAAGLRNVAVRYQADAGVVVAWFVDSQAPAPGDPLRRDAAVRLVARGVVGVPVPRLLGMTADQAENEARASGFPLTMGRRMRWQHLVGTTVTAQTPRPDTLVAPETPLGATVDVPLPLAVRLAGGIVLAAIVGVAIKGFRKPPDTDGEPPPKGSPAFRTSARAEPPSLGALDGPTLVKADVTFRVDPGTTALDMSATPDLIRNDTVLREGPSNV